VAHVRSHAEDGGGSPDQLPATGFAEVTAERAKSTRAKCPGDISIE
jgi:hypothetical protein